MNKKLIAGYTAYTTADEYGASATGDAPATTVVTFVLVYASASLGASTIITAKHGC